MADLSIYRQCIYPWQMDPPGKSGIDALNTATPDLAHLITDLYICDSHSTLGGGTGTLDGLADSVTKLAIYPTLTICY